MRKSFANNRDFILETFTRDIQNFRFIVYAKHVYTNVKYFISSYVMGETAASKVLILHGSHGCGKTTLLARVAQCCHSWLPDSIVAVRFVGISLQSMTILQILRTIITQCSIVSSGRTTYLKHVSFTKIFFIFSLNI